MDLKRGFPLGMGVAIIGFWRDERTKWTPASLCAGVPLRALSTSLGRISWEYRQGSSHRDPLAALCFHPTLLSPPLQLR